jgi:hypothetical protein
MEFLNAETVPLLGYGRVLQDHFQFIIHLPSYDSTPYNLATDSVSKSPPPQEIVLMYFMLIRNTVVVFSMLNVNNFLCINSYVISIIIIVLQWWAPVNSTMNILVALLEGLTSSLLVS